MDYDVLVLGGGIIGCAIAYELSKYNLNISVIEKDYDICNDMPSINTESVYDGLECSDEVSSKLIRKGNLLIEQYVNRFKIPYKRCGSIYIARNECEAQVVDGMYKRAQLKNIDEVKLIVGDEILQYEPNVRGQVIKALYIPNTGIVACYDFALAYGEIAFDNGVNFKLEEEVKSIEIINKGFKIKTNKNKFTCKIVIDTTRDLKLQLDDTYVPKEDKEKYMKYMVLDKSYDKLYSNIIINLGDRERSFVRPTLENDTMAAYSRRENIAYDDVVKKVEPLINNIKEKNIKMVRDWRFFNEPVNIQDEIMETGYISLNVNHYAMVTMTPALALNISRKVVEKLNCILRKDFNDKRREYFRFRELSNSERNSLIKVDNKYGNIICQCQKVTEGEIVDAIRRPLGARTVTGVKRRTGAGHGSCDGCYCKNKIVEILAREMDKRDIEIVNNSKDSVVLLGRIKEFDTM